MKKNSQKPVASSEKKTPEPWPGLFLRKFAPDHNNMPVTRLVVQLNAAGEVCSFSFSPVNEQKTYESAIVAFNLAITSYLEAQRERAVASRSPA